MEQLPLPMVGEKRGLGVTAISAGSLSLLPGGLPCPLCAQPCSRPGQLLPPGAIWGVTMGGSADSPGLWLSRKPDTKSSPLPRPSQSQRLASASVYNFWSRPGCLVWDKAQSGRATPCHHSGKQLPYSLISQDKLFPRALGAGLPTLAPEGVCLGMGVGGRQ